MLRPMCAIVPMLALALLAPASNWDSVRVDRDLVSDLRRTGVGRDIGAGRVVFERGSMRTEQMLEFSELLEKGVRDIAQYLEIPSETIRRDKLLYLISREVQISHSRDHWVFLPAWRVADHSAPYLHETVHVLAPCDFCPLWMSEGFASYVQSYVSEHVGGYDGAVFAKNGNHGIDAEAAEWLKSASGKAVLPYVGRPGPPPNIVEDRSSVAAPFYVMSQSYVKFLVTRIGLRGMLGAVDSKEPERLIAQRGGTSTDNLKTEWLTQIGAIGMSQR